MSSLREWETLCSTHVRRKGPLVSRQDVGRSSANKAVASILTPSVVPYTKGSQGATIVCRAERAVPYQSLDLA